MTELQKDPDWVERRAAQERAQEAASAAFVEAAKPVTSALRAAGLPIEGFGRFYSARAAATFGKPAFDYEKSVPILLEWLPRIDDARVKESIVRHLSTKYAKPVAGGPLIDEFVRTQEDGLKWAIGNALSVVADNALLLSLSELVGDKRHGRARQMIVLRLGRAPKRRETIDLLKTLLEDEDVALAAMSALRQQVGPEAARPWILVLIDHPSEEIRTVARRQLKQIDQGLAAKKKTKTTTGAEARSRSPSRRQ